METETIIIIAILCVAAGMYIGYTIDRTSVMNQIDKINQEVREKCVRTISWQNLSIDNITYN